MAKTGGELHSEAMPALASTTEIYFEATDWTINEIRAEARSRGWTNCHLNMRRFLDGDGRLIVVRAR